MMVSSRGKRPRSPNEKLAALSLLVPIGIVCLALAGLPLWRLHHFRHAIATVDAVWTEDASAQRPTRRGPQTLTVAKISFTRVAPDGQSIHCSETAVIGVPGDGFKIGDKVEIVPATGSCERLDVIGRSNPSSDGR